MPKLGPIEARLRELGIELPPAPKPLAAYVPGVRVGELLFVSGVGPTREGKPVYTGLVGKDLSLEEGAEAARLCALNLLAIAREAAGLERVLRVVKLTGYVASAPGFTEQSKVLNGASEFMVQVFGDRGKHARAAVGVSALPLNFAVEVEAVFQLDLGTGGMH